MGWSAESRHLPPGRAPGPQSRRRTRGRRIASWIFGALGLFFVAAALAVFGGVTGESAFVVALGLGLLALAAGARRASWAREARHLRLSVDPVEPRRGERVAVRLDVTADPGAGADVDVGLVCSEMYDYVEVVHTSSGRSRTRSTKVVDAHAEWVPAQPVAGSQQFAFVVPRDAPYSYEGDCVSWAWRVSARQRVEMGRDPVRDVPVWVLP
ncbi:MAG TPA: hypothetical protein VHF89_14120 [Solirubrobacteraceae bacterium]|nr:hypothetical protein [Solirubrobacteraceae bacterium]